MKRPAFQFYPGDWLRNANLGRCSHAARGVWVDVLCVLHDSDEYGVVRWPLSELANSAKVPLRYVRELVDKSVLKGAEKGSEVEPFVYVPHSGRRDGEPVTLIAAQVGPLWYSSRMVKDEHVRGMRGEATRFSHPEGETPKASPTASPKPPFGDGSSIALAPSGNTRDSDPDGSAVTARPMSAKDKVWALGVPLLGEGARSLLGKLAKAHGEEVLAKVLAEATLEQPVEAKAWVIAACEAKAKPKVNGNHAPGGFASGTNVQALIDRDPRPQWVIDAGFDNVWEAENLGCYAHNAQQFRGGKKAAA